MLEPYLGWHEHERAAVPNGPARHALESIVPCLADGMTALSGTVRQTRGPDRAVPNRVVPGPCRVGPPVWKTITLPSSSTHSQPETSSTTLPSPASCTCGCCWVLAGGGGHWCCWGSVLCTGGEMRAALYEHVRHDVCSGRDDSRGQEVVCELWLCFPLLRRELSQGMAGRFRSELRVRDVGRRCDQVREKSSATPGRRTCVPYVWTG
jgi:hypothetical protein